MPTFTDWYTAREARRAERFEKLTAHSPGWTATWRTPGRTRGLIAAYFTAVTIGLISIVAGPWLPSMFLVYVASLLLLAASWTVLRGTIGMRDSAPRSLLDEYEAGILDFWHRLAFRVFYWLNMVLALIVLVLAAFTDGSLAREGVLALGAVLLHTVFIAGSLPAVGYALAFNTTEKE